MLGEIQGICCGKDLWFFRTTGSYRDTLVDETSLLSTST